MTDKFITRPTIDMKISLGCLIIFAVLLLGGNLTVFAQIDALPLYRVRYVESENRGDAKSPLIRTRHLYTTDKAERDKEINLSGVDEGIEGYLLPKDVAANGTRVFTRLRRTSDWKNFYTSSNEELNSAINYSGYEVVGVIGRIWMKQIEGTIPLYRLYYPGKVRDDHLYTTSEKQRDDAVAKYQYKYEGIAGYVFAKPTKVGKNGYPNAGFPETSQQRAETINRVYQKAMGRAARKNDLDFWLPRAENFDQMLAANRDWLYSKSGAKDWTETVLTVLTVKLKRKPTDAESWGALAYFDRLKPKRMIYEEMLAQALAEKGELK